MYDNYMLQDETCNMYLHICKVLDVFHVNTPPPTTTSSSESADMTENTQPMLWLEHKKSQKPGAFYRAISSITDNPGTPVVPYYSIEELEAWFKQEYYSLQKPDFHTI
ncbi:hypothetical protein V6N13_105428 [Hibiscus sabdariffa]